MNLARPTTPLRWPLLAAAAAFAAIALPSAARATDYCVAPNTTCGGTDVPTLEQAIDLADNANDADRIFLGDATYTAPTASGYSYSNGFAPVEIIGDGEAKTVLTAPSGSTNEVLNLVAGPGSSVHDLTVHIPQNAGVGMDGIRTFNLARNVLVDEDPTQSNMRRGVELRGGSLENSVIRLSQTGDTFGVLMSDAAGTVAHCDISAKEALRTNVPTLIDRTRISGGSAGVDTFAGTTTITSSLVQASAASGSGLATITQSGTHPAIHADGVTIIGPAAGTGSGASVSTNVFPAESSDIMLKNTIIRGFGHALRATANGAGTGVISTSFSDYDPSANLATGANASLAETDVTNVGDAHFADAAGGDFHLLPGSLLVDAGDPATPGGTDLDGNTLVADGNGDAIARRDIGAFELPAASTPPGGGTQGGPAGGPSGDTPAPGGSTYPASDIRDPDTQPPLITAFKRHGSRFSFKLSEPSRVKLTILRAKKSRFGRFAALSDRAAQGANSIGLSRKRVLLPGLYRASIVAIDAAGNRSSPKRIKFRIH